MGIDKEAAVPIYKQIYEYFRKQILEGTLQEGDRIPSIREAQHLFEVARESVKRALNDLALEGYIIKIHGKGTFVAPRRGNPCFWGLIVPFYADFYNDAIMELRQAATRNGVSLEHACDYDDWKIQVDLVRDFSWRRAEAIIVIPSRNERRTLPIYQKIARQNLIVLFDRSSVASQFPYVIQDYGLAVRLSMERMEQGGSRRIAYVRDPLWPKGNPIHKTIEETYSQYCSDMPEGFLRIYDSFLDITARQYSNPDFDGLLCANDLVACKAVGMLAEHGVAVPERVQVMGNNDSELGRFFTPGIATTSPNLPGMCERMVDIISRFKAGEAVSRLQHVVLPRVVERGTVRSVPEQDRIAHSDSAQGQGLYYA